MKVSIPKRAERNCFNEPVKVANIFHRLLSLKAEHDRDKEHFWIVGLNTRLAIKYIELVSLGTMNASLVHPREVFRYAIARGSASLVLVHNHPSGSTEPSDDDVALTRRLVDAGRLLGIEVLDHIIVANGTGYVSFKERGLL